MSIIIIIIIYKRIYRMCIGPWHLLFKCETMHGVMPAYEFCRGFCTHYYIMRHKKSLKLVYAKTLSAKTLKLVLAINSNLKVYTEMHAHFDGKTSQLAYTTENTTQKFTQNFVLSLFRVVVQGTTVQNSRKEPIVVA